MFTAYDWMKPVRKQNNFQKDLGTDETYTDAELARVSVLTLDVTKTAYMSPVASVWQVP